MKRLALLLFLLNAGYACAQPTPAEEISVRSGLPASEVEDLLADCDANQMSMNFCGWRDQVVAERALQAAVERRIARRPASKSALEARIAKWKKARDASCEKSARKEWGNGSMRPAAQTSCATVATKQMTRKLLTEAPGLRP